MKIVVLDNLKYLCKCSLETSLDLGETPSPTHQSISIPLLFKLSDKALAF